MTQWFQTLGSRVVHEGHVTLRIDEITAPGGPVEREIAVPPDAVAVVATIGADVVLVRQYRHALGTTTLELPAGVLDREGEDPVEAAARELAEECRLAAGEWTRLTTLAPTPGWSSERVTLLRAHDVGPVDAPDGFEPEAEEAAMEVVRLPLDAALAAVRDGTIVDAKTAVGILLVAQQP